MGRLIGMTTKALRFAPYLLATPRTLMTELRALGFERHFMGQRFFRESDAARLCEALWGRAPSWFPTPTQRGSATLDGYASEFDDLGGSMGTSWAYDFWDAETDAWGDMPTRCGLQLIHLSFWEEPVIGRDGSGSGSRAVRLFDHDADFLIVFSVETHQRLVFTAGKGAARYLKKVRAVLEA